MPTTTWGVLSFEELLLPFQWQAAEEVANLDRGEVDTESLKLMTNLRMGVHIRCYVRQ